MAWAKLGSTKLGLGTASIDDNFSSDNFTNVGGQSGWGVSGGVMEWTTSRGSTVQGEYIALPSTFSGNFTLRFKLTPTTVAYAGTEEYLWMGLTNSNSCNSSTNQNQAGLYFHNYSTSDSKYQVTYKTNGGLFSGPVATSINFSSTAYWVEIVKDGDSVKLTLYSDEYVTAVSGGTATSTAGGATDSYTHFVVTGMYHGSSSGGGSSLGTIDDLKIYDGIAAADSIEVADLAAKKFLSIQGNILNSGQLNTVALQFNGDTGNNYARRYSKDGAADATDISQPSLEIEQGSAWSGDFMFTADVINEAGVEKLVISKWVDGTGNAARRLEVVGKWANTSNAITSVKLIQDGTGSFAADSEVTVYGTD